MKNGRARVYVKDGVDRVVNLGGFLGTSFRDKFRIHSGIDLLAGAGGRDILRVNAYVRALIAGKGDDLIVLGPAFSFEDAFRSEGGDDTVFGSSASDYISLSRDPGSDRVLGARG